MKDLDLYLSPIIEYESYIPSCSEIIGKSFLNIERGFNVKIDHYHNSPMTIDTRRTPSPNVIVKYGMSLKILGLPENVNKLRETYALP